MYSGGRARIASSTACRTIAPEKCFQAYVLSPAVGRAFRPDFLRPLWGPRIRRRSTGVRRVPVMSQARQLSWMATGTVWLSRSDTACCSATKRKLRVPPKHPNRGLTLVRPLDLEDARLAGRHRHQPVEDVDDAVVGRRLRQPHVSGHAARKHKGGGSADPEPRHSLLVASAELHKHQN